MFELYPHLFVGTIEECRLDQTDALAIVHACKSPCHQQVLNYRGSLPENHPNYLVYEKGNHLFLNMIDPPAPLFKAPLFTKSLEFIKRHIREREVLIHCNHGLSRSPSIVLLYLAKRTSAIRNESSARALISLGSIRDTIRQVE